MAEIKVQPFLSFRTKIMFPALDCDISQRPLLKARHAASKIEVFTWKKTLALLSVNDPRCRPFGKGSFVKSPIRVTMEVGGVNEATTALNPLAFGARMIHCLG